MIVILTRALTHASTACCSLVYTSNIYTPITNYEAAKNIVSSAIYLKRKDLHKVKTRRHFLCILNFAAADSVSVFFPCKTERSNVEFVHFSSFLFRSLLLKLTFMSGNRARFFNKFMYIYCVHVFLTWFSKR